MIVRQFTDQRRRQASKTGWTRQLIEFLIDIYVYNAIIRRYKNWSILFGLSGDDHGSRYSTRFISNRFYPLSLTHDKKRNREDW